MSGPIRQAATVGDELGGLRLDRAAAALFPEHSRARLQGWIRDGSLTRNGGAARQRDPVAPGDRLALAAPEPEPAPGGWAGEAMPVDIRYEDECIIVLDKPPGLVVHPAAGHRAGTLVNALLHRRPELAALPRAGIVHRLDRDTSGLMVVAASLRSHTALVAQLRERRIAREYAAVCSGALTGGGTIDAPIGRHPRQRTKMAVLAKGGKQAITHYRIARRFVHHTWLRVRLETGRTHQIRVHLAHRGHPLVGDKTYGGRPRPPAGADSGLAAALRSFPRQALHARRLRLEHPGSGERREWSSPLPADMRALLDALARHDAP